MIRKVRFAMYTGALLLFVGAMAVSAATAPPLDKGSNATADAPTLVGAFSRGDDGSVTMLNRNGSVVWQHYGPVSYTSVYRLDSGNILAAYQARTDSGDITGVRVLTPDNETVWDWHFSVSSGRNSEIHDAEPLPSGDILLVDMDRERIVIVDRETKRISWQWNSSAFYEAPPDPTQRDWLHINDVDRIGDGRYLISVRNANQLLIVERGQGVVEVINRDDRDGNDDNCRGLKDNQLVGENPRCGDPSILNHQHNPQWLGDGAVLVADSENDRVVELHRTNGSWSVAWSATGANGLPFDWPRDADRLLNGNTLVVDTMNERLVEISESGETVWRADLPPQPYAAVRGGSEYPAGPKYEAGSVGPETFQPIATVSILYGLLQHELPLPYWMHSGHLLVGLISLLIVLSAELLGMGAGRIPTPMTPSDPGEDSDENTTNTTTND